MKDTVIFEKISNMFKEAGISPILVGGFAVNYYKYARQTIDIDFLLEREDFKKIEKSLRKLGYKPYNETENFIRFRSDIPYLMDIDFMFVERDTYEMMFRNVEIFRIAGQEFFVPSLFNLIAMKLHSIKNNREYRQAKDLPDIYNLIKMNNVDVNNEDFKELCLKFGTNEIYDEIIKSV
ncbi:nucleotidyl transferase AbiEii/AbiGii toxin family protein [Candidatus Auribacterota bacterium]